MPRGDGTGPNGQGPMTGRGMGRCIRNKNFVTINRGRCRGMGRGMGRGNGIRGVRNG